MENRREKEPEEEPIQRYFKISGMWLIHVGTVTSETKKKKTKKNKGDFNFILTEWEKKIARSLKLCVSDILLHNFSF